MHAAADTDAKEQPEAFFTALLDNGGLLYAKRPVYNVMVEVEAELRRFIKSFDLINRFTYINMQKAVLGSAQLRSAFCAALSAVGVDVSACEGVAKWVYDTLVTKWLHMRQKELCWQITERIQNVSDKHMVPLRQGLKAYRARPAACPLASKARTVLFVADKEEADLDADEAHSMLQALVTDSDNFMFSLTVPQLQQLTQVYVPAADRRHVPVGSHDEDTLVMYIEALKCAILAACDAPAHLEDALSACATGAAIIYPDPMQVDGVGRGLGGAGAAAGPASASADEDDDFDVLDLLLADQMEQQYYSNKAGQQQQQHMLHAPQQHVVPVQAVQQQLAQLQTPQHHQAYMVQVKQQQQQQAVRLPHAVPHQQVQLVLHPQQHKQHAQPGAGPRGVPLAQQPLRPNAAALTALIHQQQGPGQVSSRLEHAADVAGSYAHVQHTPAMHQVHQAYPNSIAQRPPAWRSYDQSPMHVMSGVHQGMAEHSVQHDVGGMPGARVEGTSGSVSGRGRGGQHGTGGRGGGGGGGRQGRDQVLPAAGAASGKRQPDQQVTRAHFLPERKTPGADRNKGRRLEEVDGVPGAVDDGGTSSTVVGATVVASKTVKALTFGGYS
jgi:hypothetical protein